MLYLYSIFDWDSHDCVYNLNNVNEMRIVIENKKFHNCKYNDNS